ncbi:MAG: hypothetical protein AABX86_00805 [Nanoarchaeota archaeon]
MEKKTIDALQWIIGILKKNNATYQISGGFAARLYNSPRLLNDIDIEIPDRFIKQVEYLGL